MKIGFLSIMCLVLLGCAVTSNEQVVQRGVYYVPLVQSDVMPQSQHNKVQQISDRPKHSSPVGAGQTVNHATYAPVIQ